MSVNRRYAKRYPADFGVCVCDRDKRTFEARATNLSADGMFIQSESLTLPKGNLVDLEFSLQDHNWHLEALVVHASKGGLGMMFRRPQPSLARHPGPQELQNPSFAGLFAFSPFGRRHLPR